MDNMRFSDWRAAANRCLHVPRMFSSPSTFGSGCKDRSQPQDSEGCQSLVGSKDRVTVSLSSFFDDDGSGLRKTTAAYDAAVKKYNSIYDGFLGDDGQPGDVMKCRS